MKKVAIIDFKVGNIFSVVQACEEIGLTVEVTSDYNTILSSDGAILPGVGAFGDAMLNLKNQNLIVAIKDFINTGRPFMGICLGFQLLFSFSEEFGIHKGLDILKGDVKKFDNSSDKVPQIGWNKIFKVNKDWGNTPLKKTMNNEFMYFV